MFPFKLKVPEPNPRFASLEQEWSWIRSNQRRIKHIEPPFWIQKLQFIAMRNLETEGLLVKFDTTASQLGKLLHNEKWFEIFCDLIKNPKD